MSKHAVTKKDIVRVISEETGLTQKSTMAVVQRTFDCIIETLVAEGRIELRNFGIFEVKTRAARTARNPKTGTQVEVPEKFVVSFKPGKVMENRVSELTDQPARPEWLDQHILMKEAEEEARQSQKMQRQSQHPPEQTSPESGTDNLPLRPTGRWG